MPLLSVSDQLLGVKDISIIRNVPCIYIYIFVYDEHHERYSPLKIMSLKGQMHNYRMKYTENGCSLTLVRSWTYDTMRISWGGVQVMDKNDPVNLPVTATVALRHKIMTRKIAQWLGEVQYMLKQGSSWHDITDYYRARKKAVNLKAETGDKEVMQSPKKAERKKSQKKEQVQEEPVEVQKTLSSEEPEVLLRLITNI